MYIVYSGLCHAYRGPILALKTMKLFVSIALWISMLVPSFAMSLSSAEQPEVPRALAKKLAKLAGPSARSCGVVVSDEERKAGNVCMGLAHNSNTPFTFVLGTPVGKSGIWFAWAGSREGKVYQIFLMNDDVKAKDIFAAECAVFEITESKGVHCTLGE